MKIAFDYQVFSQQSYGGISRYFAKLAAALGDLGDEPKIFSPIHKNSYLEELPPRAVNGFRLRRFPLGAKSLIKYLNPIMSRHRIKNWNPDVVHATYYDGGATASAAAPYVVTVYDMIHEKFRQKIRSRDRTIKLKEASIERADHVLCISENTKKDVVEILDIDPAKLTVVYLGADGTGKTSMHEGDHFPKRRPFLLYVGNRSGYKNFSGFLKAVASSKNLKNDFEICAFGGKPFSKIELNEIEKLGFGKGRVCHAAGQDGILTDLYQRAAAFIYPSLYEGFGLPPLEAMVHGCPVVSSNTSSMPEVVGDAGVYFDPYSTDSIANAIEQVVYSSILPRSLVEKGYQQAEAFTWQRCAEGTRKVYKNVAA